MYRFIDVFAGIGGFHLAMSDLECECVYASEIDPYARKTYQANFKIKDEIFNNDITKQDVSEIPDFDILCGGFPCQPFSQAGYKRGFEDAGRGNLFFKLADIINEKKPKAVFLENVRHLMRHDHGKTYEVIQNTFDEIGYDLHTKVFKASDFNLPQHRPRVYMVAFKKKDSVDFKFPEPIPLNTTMSDIWGGDCTRKIGYTLRVGGRGSGIDDRRNWDMYMVDGEIRTLGPVEGKKMMGFPDDFVFPVSETQAMKQLGNAVAVNVVQAIGKEIVKSLNTIK